jgi:hypothetical protein
VSGFDPQRLAHLAQAMQLHVEQDRVGGVAWLLAASDHVEVAGGMGSMWSNDPSNTLVGVILSTDAFGGPFPPPAIIQDLWTGAYTALDN